MYHPEPVFDKRLLRRRFSRALEEYDQAAVVQAEMASRLLKALYDLGISPARVLEVGAGTGLFTRKFEKVFNPAFYVASDIVPECAGFFRGSSCHFVAADGEQLPFRPGSFDLIVSNATFQWFLAPKVSFEEMARLLAPQGILAFTTFGPATMLELTPSQRPPALLSAEELMRLKPASFYSLKTACWRKVLYFQSPEETLRHLRKTGAMGFLRANWSLKDLRLWKERYKAFGEERGFPLTFEPILMVWQKR